MKKTINPELLASIAAGAALKTSSPSDSSEIPLSLIDPNPYQPRLDYDPIVVRERADSIEKHGLLQPIALRRDGDRYTLIAGQTRLEAHKLLGRETIKSNIIDASDEDIASLALIENVQRTDLHPIEIQIALSREPFASMNDEEIRGITGYSLTKIRNIRSISRLSEEVREHMSANRPKIGVDLLVELQKFPDDSQFNYYLRVVDGDIDRQFLRREIALWKQLQGRKKFDERVRSPNFIKDKTHYYMHVSHIDKKKQSKFEKELEELITKYKFNGV